MYQDTSKIPPELLGMLGGQDHVPKQVPPQIAELAGSKKNRKNRKVVVTIKQQAVDGSMVPMSLPHGIA